nr:MAG TPA: hypothetical protein [Caudoviricetes sp.]
MTKVTTKYYVFRDKEEGEFLKRRLTEAIFGEGELNGL